MANQIEEQPRLLRLALIFFGVSFLFIWPVSQLWPPGFKWTPHHLYYELMMTGIYMTLGVFLILASRNPLKHLSLIWFTIVSSVVHGAIMTVEALSEEIHYAHLIGDVPLLFLVAIVLGVLTPRRFSETNAP